MKVLVVSPHPDDESIGCGGTLRKHIIEGDHVRVLFITSGEHGGHGLDQEEMSDIREREAQQAATILGISDIEFWRQPDGALRASHRLIERFVESIQSYGPDLIYVPNEQESHPDHRAAARLVRAARQRVTTSPTVLMFEVWTPLAAIDEIIDITPHMETKLAAIKTYKSQCSVLRFDEAMLGLARYRGELFCWPKSEEDSGRYAEVFRKQAP
jgi:LmbE family N-acetylglucosaminyl deacetylase